jgi:hypothetical protein
LKNVCHYFGFWILIWCKYINFRVLNSNIVIEIYDLEIIHNLFLCQACNQAWLDDSFASVYVAWGFWEHFTVGLCVHVHLHLISLRHLYVLICALGHLRDKIQG